MSAKDKINSGCIFSFMLSTGQWLILRALVWPRWTKLICHAFSLSGCCLHVQLMCSGLVHCALSAGPVYCLNDEVKQVPVSHSITWARTCGRWWAHVARGDTVWKKMKKTKKWCLAFVVFVLLLLCISINNDKKEVWGLWVREKFRHPFRALSAV